MKIDWAVVFATLVGPILAVWASEWRQRRRAARERQEWIFRTLMTTRSAPLRQEHVSALNHIDFAFPQKQYPKIIDAWGLYFAHLGKPQGDTPEAQDRWGETANNLLADLIHLMATSLDIPFSKTQIKQPAYYPKGHAFTESQLDELRVLLLEVLKGHRSLPIAPGPQNQREPQFARDEEQAPRP